MSAGWLVGIAVSSAAWLAVHLSELVPKAMRLP